MHEEPATINAAFLSQYSEGRGMDRLEQLHRWNKLARQLVATTCKDKVPGLERRAKEVHEREQKEWGLELQDIGQAEDIQL